VIAILLGLATFFLIWHGSILLGRLNGERSSGRTGVAAFFGAGVGLVTLVGEWGILYAVAGTGYAGFMWWEVWREARKLPPQAPQSVPSVPDAVGQERPRIRSKRGGGRRPKDGQYLDVIRFDYEDRDGDASTREVEVTGVDESYLEGWCRERRARRTFRLDRISGTVVSLETGEVQSPFRWASKMALDPQNKSINQEQWFR